MIDEKKKCEGCGVVEGGAIEHEILVDYRGHLICSWCKANWQHREEVCGGIIDFDEYLKPVTKKVVKS